MDAISCYTPVSFARTNLTESNSTNKKYKTSESCCLEQAENDLIVASVFLNLMSTTVKQLGKQVQSLQKENIELRQRLEDQEPKKLNLVA